MIQKIANEKKLQKCICHKFVDAGIEVSVDDSLTEDEYIGIKVDDYYMGLNLQGLTPKAVDFIVAVDCTCDNYALYIMEYKNTKSPGGYTTSDINEKFDTTINRFMKDEFDSIFECDRFKYKSIKLFLVTTAYKDANRYGKYEDYLKVQRRVKNKDSLDNDLYLSDKIFKFRNRPLRIQRELPPNPIIKKIL